MSERRTLLVLIARIEALKTELLLRLYQMEPPPNDRLLTVEEAAAILSVTTDWLYRHADKLPSTRRPGPGQVRFSSVGIQVYLRRR